MGGQAGGALGVLAEGINGLPRLETVQQTQHLRRQTRMLTGAGGSCRYSPSRDSHRAAQGIAPRAAHLPESPSLVEISLVVVHSTRSSTDHR